MVLAVTKLQQPLLGHAPIAADRRPIHPDTAWSQIVHPDRLAVQMTFKAGPPLIIAQDRQDPGQPVIAPSQPVQGLPSATPQALQPLLCPRLDLVEPVVSLRQNMAQPDRRRPAQAQPLPVAVHQKVFIQQLRQSQLEHVGQQYRIIINSFSNYSKLFGHTRSLLHPQLLSKNERTERCSFSERKV